jgi:hypothetical protein
MVPLADRPWLEDAAVVDNAAGSVAEDELVTEELVVVGLGEVSVAVT